MNLNNLSAKKICRLVSAGMVFSMLVITGIFGGIMQDIRIFIVGGTLTLCDPRNPSVAGIMHNDGKHPGIGAVLRNKVSLHHALTDPGIPDVNLRVMFGGHPNTEDAALLGSRKMEELIDELRGQADYVILDTAPAELLADARCGPDRAK